MPKQVSKLVLEHQSPGFIQRFPQLLWLQHLVSWLMTLRLWYVRREIRRCYKKNTTLSSLLDIGCGSGELLFSLAKAKPHTSFYGLDMNENAIAIARDYAKFKARKNVTFIQAPINQYHTDQLFDLISCISVLHYIPKPDQVLKTFSRMLSPSGQLLINIPVNEKRIIPGYHWIRKGWLRKVSYDSHYSIELEMSVDVLIQFVQQAGLQVRKQIFTYGWAGKLAYELFSFGQLFILRVNWLWAVLFALIYFPIVTLPAWILMLLDFTLSNRTGNGILLVCERLSDQKS